MNPPTAYIHPKAKIGENVTVEPFAVIYENVEIGDGTWVGPHATIFPGARIGKNCKIYPGASISAVPQDLKFAGEETVTLVGDNTTIREAVTINRGTVDKHRTEVGQNCLIMAYVHVAHDCIIGNNCIIANAVQLAGHVTVDDYAFIGGTSAVHQFVRIGKHAMVSGGSLVRKDVPPFTKAGREPLSYVGINSVGLKRRGFTAQQLSDVKNMYRLIYQNGLNNTQALAQIETELAATSERELVLEFVRGSKRGIMKGAGNAAARLDEDDD
jgi:UDP-N-acetylglucosamine acyltransferase